MFASALRRDIANGPFEDFEQGLLDTFARDIASDGDVFGLAGDLIYFIDVNDAALGALEIVIGILEKAQDDIFDVFTDIAGFGESGGIGNGKGDIKDLSEAPSEQSFAGAGRTDHEDVT